eukprot:CAMPEP_0201632868 /NCGR_PEP_ID=MMETSP0493-20130528/6367_1 /ASSEMBLY_ACC=CAM_ASM_000838 /TAXON_ID=420259 /ORGANISM="Thalassiosira gravida, Strain GMp14c1" /LENGTH=315 /DNA_ID=CAMNT_0048104473 /DNA_START=40 /DNA_END=987 /DNA_ORIENTATION=+
MTTNPTPSSSSSDDDENGTKNLDEITILGFGSLLSLQSSRLTFPTLRNFRLGRVPNHRRVFAHPASIFFKRNIANLDTLEMSSLSCEYEEGHSFVCSIFEVPNEGLTAAVATSDSDDGNERSGSWIPSQAFLEREEEFEIAMVLYEELTPMDAKNGTSMVPMRTETSPSDDTTASSSSSAQKQPPVQKGVICRRSTDEAYIAQWGQVHWENQYTKYGVKTIWNWERDSGLRPCPAYLRHCVLASWNCGNNGDGGATKSNSDGWSGVDGDGGLCYDSFLDDTYLVDRKTTIREYLKQFPEVMAMEPPESLRERYGG